MENNAQPKQVAGLETLKQACDAIEKLQGVMTVPRVGGYCQNTLQKPPATQTINNMSVMVDGQTGREHVYKTYVNKRASEYTRDRTNGRKEQHQKRISYYDLANRIKDDDTRSWVRELVQVLEFAEQRAKNIEDQLTLLSQEKGGLDIAQAIEAGPADENLRLPGK